MDTGRIREKVMGMNMIELHCMSVGNSQKY